jgi:hypothetical protein
MKEYAIIVNEHIIGFTTDNDVLNFYNNFTGSSCLLIPVESTSSLSIGMRYDENTNIFL